MKSICSLYKLKMRAVLKSAVLVIPTVMTVAFLGIMYSIMPAHVCGSFLMSGFFLFAISVYLSMLIQMNENDVFEEVLFLHSHSTFGYYIAREMVLVSITLVYTVMLIIYPLIRSSLHHGFFSRPIKPEDVLYGSLILVGSGFCGIALGDLFHHRIFGRARFAVMGVILVSILAVCKLGLADSFPVLKVLSVITPPIMDGFKMVGDSDLFDKTGSLIIFAHMLAFSVVSVAIKIRLLKHLKW